MIQRGFTERLLSVLGHSASALIALLMLCCSGIVLEVVTRGPRRTESTHWACMSAETSGLTCGVSTSNHLKIERTCAKGAKDDAPMHVENENTFQAALRSGLNLFLGAGFSVLAKNIDDQALPVGADLRRALIAAFGFEGLDTLDLAQLCTVIESSRAVELRDFLHRTFQVSAFDQRYLNLDKMALSHIFTTNIDDLAFRIFEKDAYHYLNDVALKGPVRCDRFAINYIALHGSLLHRDAKLTFATTGIASAFAQDPDLWHMLTSQMQQTPTLFWGYGLADAGVLQSLSPDIIKGRELKDKWIVLRKEDSATEQYFRALRFNIIVADTSEMLDYLANLPSRARSDGLIESTSVLFPEEAVPAIGTGPVRPLLDFYLGDAPTWADIYSGRIHRTKHFSAIVDRIHGRRNTVVIGIPACGKTTLLMQCAAAVPFDGHKLVTRTCTEEKARHLCMRLGGARALIFVDDFAESIGAVAYLMSQQNVTLVAFEREHNYEIVSHKLERSQYELLDVTDLSDVDIQEVFSRIAPEIRRHRYKHVETQAGVQISLFEVIEANISRPTLKRRFRELLDRLGDDSNVRDLLVMIAYVHVCRTPVSFDMAHAFLRERVTDYSDIYSLVENLGRLVSSYSGSLIDGDQDHYVPRSAVVSEAILEEVSGPVFRDVLVRFHSHISPFRVCRFDVFKRRAFDADFVGKAFPNWSEGKDFYDELYSRDPSPYLRQQGALYLSHKKRFHEAFSWIDQALLQSGGKIPSIRHTHAIILFNANIGLAAQEDVRLLLDQSMSILTSCYHYDRRKSYHALTFADQALKYWGAYGDDVAVTYLVTALRWLEDEQRRSPWHRKVRALALRVGDTLQQAKC
ncbi:MAG: SIR2 family protein [Kofleriaceae bacterium]|nr:SIR2 family protein [Kofleriaceae bacterium]MBP9165861.1 SIR2 family protein [Kofleriaceae bacterium]MBP9862857.1 SIR2 family protein [Kofleriaceae bacterium]